LKTSQRHKHLKILWTPGWGPFTYQSLVLGYVREFGVVLRIADLDEGVRLEIKEVSAHKAARKTVSSIWSGTAYW
jgi:hypothetical protein